MPPPTGPIRNPTRTHSFVILSFWSCSSLAAAAREEQLQKDKMTKECVLVGFLMGPVGGGILLGLAGCVSCAQHAHEYNSLLPPFHLFNGLFYGALIGVVV